MSPRITAPTPPASSQGRGLRRGDVGWLTALAGLMAVLLQFVPWLAVAGYPLRLLLTLVHEAGHGLAALLSGGSFHRLVVSADGSGLAYTSGGWRLLIIPAGYLGVAIFGAALILLARSPRVGRFSLGVLGIALALLSLRYGLPSVAAGEIGPGLLASAIGVVFGGLLLWISVGASAAWIVFAAHLLAFSAGLTALTDLLDLVGLSVDRAALANDALAMAEVTFVPAVVWALLWTALAATLIGGAIRVAWWRRTDTRTVPGAGKPA